MKRIFAISIVAAIAATTPSFAHDWDDDDDNAGAAFFGGLLGGFAAGAVQPGYTYQQPRYARPYYQQPRCYWVQDAWGRQFQQCY